ncbi:5-hydroxytryptamine receptor-like isoform X2 [Anopheles stephensi]|uniref:5-hydroxytryptamine receptor-like isoform X2 n=1 Tax=Anopheles stephensi TaxID=30069 RepID=UPI0016589638|nr:5-hydroxytryptamine receptor-like isoform X2 [Anopheles stephensi]
MALTDGRRPTKESHAWTAWPWSTARDTARVTPSPAGSSTGIVSSTSTTITSYTASPPTVSFPAAFHSSSTSSRPPFSSTGAPSVRSRTRLTTVVDQLSSLVSSTVTDTDDGTDGDLSTPVSSSAGTGNPTSPSFPTPEAGSVRNLTQTFLSNYTTVTADYAGDNSNGSAYFASPSATAMGDRGSTLPGGLSLSLPDLLEEDELMALWNCTNCFLLNYGAAGGVNSTGKYYGNGTVDPRDGLLPSHDDDALASETTIYLIRVIATAIVLGIVILATVIGNVFVIAAILLERNLQSVANHLILSLAVADLLVACLVMPLGAVYEVSKEWRLGADLCDMWTSSDVLCCTASILHLVAIALDRYWAVTDIDYAHQRTARRIGYMIIIIWTLSVLVSIAPLLGWKDPEWETRVYQDLQCIVSQDVGYQIFATASSFYVPLLVILFLYWRIFLAARKRIRRRQQAAQTHPEPLAKASCMALTSIGFRWKVTATQTASGGGMIANVAGGSGGIAAAVVAVIGRPLPTISETTTAFTNVSSANTSPEKGSLGNGIERDRIEIDPPTADISMAYPSGNQASCSSTRPPGSSGLASRKKTQSSTDSKRERKAAKTLAIITGAFVCCWLPFFIIAILLPTCTTCNISPLITSVCLWLGYFNSTLNPIIYTIFSPEFRHAFKRILCGRRYSLRRTRNLGVRHMR